MAQINGGFVFFNALEVNLDLLHLRLLRLSTLLIVQVLSNPNQMGLLDMRRGVTENEIPVMICQIVSEI